MQFPLVPAAAVTIHKCKGSTLKNVVLNMDPNLSSELGNNVGLARHFYQHAHYVAASQVSSLEGLQIFNWAPHLISVNPEVQVHMEYMNTQKVGTMLCTTTYHRKFLQMFIYKYKISAQAYQ